MFRRAGNVIVLIEPNIVRPAAERDRERLDGLLATLEQRNFLQSAMRVEAGGVVHGLEEASRASGLGCRVRLEEVAPSGGVPCAIVTTSRQAHLALAQVVERGGRFVAHAVGVVLEEPVVEIVCGAGSVVREPG